VIKLRRELRPCNHCAMKKGQVDDEHTTTAGDAVQILELRRNIAMIFLLVAMFVTLWFYSKYGHLRDLADAAFRMGEALSHAESL
jgi:hypothetical protein